MYIPDKAAYMAIFNNAQNAGFTDAQKLEVMDALSKFEIEHPLLFDDLDYLLRKEPLSDPDPQYRYGLYDVVFCKTCCQSSMEPEIKECEGCQKDVCPHCCGTSFGWHELCRRDCDGEVNPILDRLAFALGLEQPIDMLLYCPNCGNQHIDAPDPARNWTNPPHKSHECQYCDQSNGTPFVWRPSDRYTNGVKGIKTTGKVDCDPRPKTMIALQKRTVIP